MRRSLATELLENTHMGIDMIAERIGFADATSFSEGVQEVDEPFAFRFPSSGAERLEQHRCPQQQKSPARLTARPAVLPSVQGETSSGSSPGKRMMRIDKRSTAVHCCTSKTIEQFSPIFQMSAALRSCQRMIQSRCRQSPAGCICHGTSLRRHPRKKPRCSRFGRTTGCSPAVVNSSMLLSSARVGPENGTGADQISRLQVCSR